MNKDLEYYKDCFSSLNTMKKCGKPAPHKALLLLSIIDLIERGVITNCRVPLSEDLVRQFKRNTSALLGESKLFQFDAIDFYICLCKFDNKIKRNLYGEP